ncbi:MAG: D-alanyl-D-alanine carboxypeptidase family protein, partial [Actinomycetes bacterium]
MKPSPTRVAALAALCALLLPAGPASAATTESAPGPVGGPRLGSTGVVVDAPAGTRPLPRLSARSFVLADAGSGDVLAARDPHGRLRPASTQKILTALTLLPELDPATVYTATFDDANVEGSKVGVVPDATYTVHNLFEGLILMSGNDAANALARAAGGVRRTVAKMNTTARELGALDTTVRNPSGLDAPGQLTSAYDLALL